MDAPGDRSPRCRQPRLRTVARRAGRAERDVVLPGTTHIQPAQPVLFAHHLLAYVEMVERDRARLTDARGRTNVSPLGGGRAGRGRLSPRPRGDGPELDFEGVTANSLDAVSGPGLRRRDARGDRARDGPPQPAGRGADVVVEPGVRLRPGVGCVLDRQQHDAEQEEPRSRRARPWPRRPRHRGADRDPRDAQGPAAGVPARPPGGQGAAVRCGRGLRGVTGRPGRDAGHAVRRRRPHAAAATGGYTTATAVADSLVRRGVPFRTAHHVVGSLVAHAEEAGIGLDELPDETIAAALPQRTNRRRSRWPTSRGSGATCVRPRAWTAHWRPATSSAARRRARVTAALKVARKRLDRE